MVSNLLLALPAEEALDTAFIPRKQYPNQTQKLEEVKKSLKLLPGGSVRVNSHPILWGKEAPG